MSTAAGAKCDQCGTVDLSPVGVGIGTVPVGWLVVYGPVDSHDLGITETRHDFCSLRCVALSTQMWREAETGLTARSHRDE